MQVVRAGRSGQFTARVQLTATGPRSDQISRVETEFVVAPEALTAFLQGLERLISDQNTDSASLSGDAEAVA
jgi:hypothetical protein